jgi:glycosyltransferase involved in cell wall biosynthesis
MAYGVVPIVSNNGFNKQVIKNAGVTLEINATANDYFGEIDKILTNKLWLKLSENSRHRVIDNFSNSAVSESFFNFLNLNKK